MAIFLLGNFPTVVLMRILCVRVKLINKYYSLLVVMGLAMGGLLELMGPDVGCAFPIYTPE